MQFFTSSNDLKKWVESFGSADEAALNIMEVVGKNEERDIVQSCRSIFENQDDSAANVLFGILSKHNITQIREGNMKDKLVKEAQAVMRSDSLYGNMDMRFCPKLPKQSAGQGLISTYNCRTYCLDSIVLDDDPNRVYCAEALWRRHVMDKFAREFKDKDGHWVGGYINERFQIFRDDGGNNMELAHGERTRKPRPHQYSTERRLEEARGEKTTDLTAFDKNKMVKLAEDKSKTRYQVVDNEFNRTNYPDMIGKTLDTPPAYANVKLIKEDAIDKQAGNDTYKIFDDMIEMKQAGLTDEDIIYKVAEHYNKTIISVASLYKVANRMINSHNGTVYSHNKTAKTSEVIKIAQISMPEKSTMVSKKDVEIVTMADGQKRMLKMETPVVIVSNTDGNPVLQIVDGPDAGKQFKLSNKMDINEAFGVVEDMQEGSIQEAASELGLNEENASAQNEDFPIEVK